MTVIFVVVAVVAAIVGAAIMIVGRRPFRSIRIDERLQPIAVAVANRIRLRNVIAVAAALIVGVGLVYIAIAAPEDLGRSVVYAPTLSAAVGIAFFMIVPAYRESSPLRSAELVPRTALSFAERKTFVFAGAFAVAVTAMVIVFGLVAEPDGRSIGYRYDLLEYSFSASPFPGFFYGVPVLAATVVLVGVVVLAIGRIVRAPRPGDEVLRAADAALRELAVGVVLRAAAAGYAATLSLMLLGASTPTISVSQGIEEEGIGGPTLARDLALTAIGVAEIILGVVFAVAAIVFAISAVARAVRSPLALEPVDA